METRQREREPFDDYLDSVLSSVTQMTGGLVPTDEVPYKAVLYHYSSGHTAYLAADTISRER